MKLSLVSIEKEGLIRVATDGNITSTDFQADGKNPLEQIMGQTWSSNKVLLDMDKTNYIDSTAIGWLISCHKEFKSHSGVFVVHNVQPAVKQVLDLLKIGKVVPIVENEAAARAFAIGAGMMFNKSTTQAAATAAANTLAANDAANVLAAELAAGQRAPMMLDVTKFPTDKQVDALIDHAVGLGASDLFFTSNDQHVAILVRHLGIIKPISVLPSEAGRRAMSHIKALAGMDLTEKRRPADGRWIFERVNGDTVDLRINCIPTVYGEDFALRILARGSKLFQLDNLGMTPQQEQGFKQMVDSPSGLLLITGPTGSGKTATLYSSLIKLNDGSRKINTIEDPVEYTISGLRQSQVNPLIQLGFSELLRSVLRQSPDVVMVGEIRDAETAQTAVHAGNSGMLVLATIHAPAAAGAVQSMRSLGVHSHFLSTSLRGIASQRLVRTFCPKCRQAFDLSDAPHTFDEVKQWLGPNEGKTLYAPKGCEACAMEGYSGRTGVFEVMPITRNIRNLISDGKPARDIRAKAVEEGMLEFRHAALLKVARGETSTEEVFRVIPSEHLLLED